MAQGPTTGVGRVRLIRADGAPVLRQVSAPVASGDRELDADIADLATTLGDFRERAGFGRAISAPQIGIGKRLIVLDLGSGARPIINPEITWRSPETQLVWDDCLSVPGVLVRVERHASISLRYRTPTPTSNLGAWTVWRDLPPDLAELLQHEIDHLDGVLMTDRATGPDPIAPMSRRGDLQGES
jgi:peptide deformylase